MDNPNLQRGIQLFENGRYKASIPYFKTSLTKNINNYTAKFLLAQAYFQTDDDEKAYKISIELRNEYPNEPDIYFLLSQIYLNKENEQEALLLINKAITLDPFDENYFGQKAYILLKQKQFEEALLLANEGLKINAKSTFCLNARTTALTKLKRKDEAQQTINSLLFDNPDNANSHANVGWSYLERNDNATALIHFKEALMLDPNIDYARSGMLTALKAKNKLYNLYLSYSFWLSNKSKKNQWVFIIGLYLVFNIAIKILSATNLSIIVIPLLIAYLLFALGGWIMDPLSNMILLFDKYGKYLLNKNDTLSGQLFFALLLSTLLFFIIYLATETNLFILISFASLAAILPLTKGALHETKKKRNVNFIYGSVFFIIALVGTLIGYPYTPIALTIGLLFIGYTWLGNLL